MQRGPLKVVIRGRCNLLPSECHLFGPLKEHPGGKIFRSNEEVTQAVQEWLYRQPKDFFLSGIHKLPDS
jgi:hypothetical protein